MSVVLKQGCTQSISAVHRKLWSWARGWQTNWLTQRDSFKVQMTIPEKKGETGQEATIKLIWPLKNILFNSTHTVSVNPVAHCCQHPVACCKENVNRWKDVFVLSAFVQTQCHEALNKILTYCSEFRWLLSLSFVGLCMGGLLFPLLPPLFGSVWQRTLLCCLWCQAAGPLESPRSQASNREKGPLCDWINFWAPHCLINENDPGAESEAIVCTVTKSLPINSIPNRISQSTPGVLNLLA